MCLPVTGSPGKEAELHTHVGWKEGIVHAAGAARLVASLRRPVVDGQRGASRAGATGTRVCRHWDGDTALGAGGSDGLTINRH